MGPERKTRIRWRPEAVEEFLRAIEYLALVRPGLAEEFESEIKVALDKIADNPEIWRKVYGDVRRYLTEKFRYKIFYMELDDWLEVIAIAHGSRHPDFWKKRILDDEQR